jgi:uncharacterized membrane protein (DUF2068 family)
MRGVALFEATKGLVVVLAGCGLLSLVHHDVQAVAEQFVARLHLNPAKHTARVFLEAARDLSDARLRLLAILALLYAAVRLAEAYGLWFAQRWAQWLAALSGGIYVPMEVVELGHGVSWLKVAALVANLAVVVYVASLLRAQSRPTRGGPTP